ncbi:MAG: isoprenylcysteine carboxylmethyltransferase family protein [Victivallales bacterium]|jgi:protein-S-isoprenylcysteine O-methyltransferase Ste14
MMKASPPVYVLAALVAMLAAHMLVPIVRIIAFPWRLLGGVPLLFGAALVFYSLRLFRLHKTTPEPFGVSGALVTSGPFRVTRNPMYAGILLMFSGIACLLGTVGPWLVVLLLGMVFDIVFVRREEERMEMIFGDAYRRYKTRVRRWI